MDFYDIIFNRNSMHNIQNRWKKKSCDNVKKRIDSNEIKEKRFIPLIGKINSGKSFLLKSLSEEDLPTVISINAKELRKRYSKEKNVLLDSKDCKPQKLCYYFNMLDISRDKLFKMNSKISFIINYCNIFILVIGKLTFSEQKIITKVFQNIKGLEIKRTSKNLIIIHNLQTFGVKDKIEYNEKNFLKSIILENGK